MKISMPQLHNRKAKLNTSTTDDALLIMYHIRKLQDRTLTHSEQISIIFKTSGYFKVSLNITGILIMIYNDPLLIRNIGHRIHTF